MSQFQCIKKNPYSINKYLEKQIIELHKRYFTLDSQQIISLLKERDEIHLYIDRKNNTLIGTIGLQWIEFNDFVVLYIGNAVVDERYHCHGLLTKSILYGTFKTIIKYPKKVKAAVSLSTTPEAFDYFKSFKNTWPRPDNETPDKVSSMIRDFCCMFCKSGFDCINGVYITRPKLDNFNVNITKNNPHQMTTPFALWFKNVNPRYLNGFQIVTWANIDARNLFALMEKYIYKAKKNITSILRDKKRIFSDYKFFLISIFVVVLFFQIMVE